MSHATSALEMSSMRAMAKVENRATFSFYEIVILLSSHGWFLTRKQVEPIQPALRLTKAAATSLQRTQQQRRLDLR
jgi:hypothetical protein